MSRLKTFEAWRPVDLAVIAALVVALGIGRLLMEFLPVWECVAIALPTAVVVFLAILITLGRDPKDITVGSAVIMVLVILSVPWVVRKVHAMKVHAKESVQQPAK